MWILFLILITSPGSYEVHPIATYKTPTAKMECENAKDVILKDFKIQYPAKNDEDTYAVVCLKQKEVEA